MFLKQLGFAEMFFSLQDMILVEIRPSTISFNSAPWSHEVCTKSKSWIPEFQRNRDSYLGFGLCSGTMLVVGRVYWYDISWYMLWIIYLIYPYGLYIYIYLQLYKHIYVKVGVAPHSCVLRDQCKIPGAGCRCQSGQGGGSTEAGWGYECLPFDARCAWIRQKKVCPLENDAKRFKNQYECFRK